ncbi:hypothetical protein K402DRAFT_308127, partial [Aulographum hederae CBS 113979]
KLGTMAGVFVPTTLNVLSILMFLRFGFILGQGGVVGTLGMLVACYIIDLLTTMSVSAIASNGTVRGGGAYYLISRSLGPEFGGSIGIVFYLGSVFNTGMNAVGLIDCLTYNFGKTSGNWARWLPDSFWYDYLWATVVLVFCTGICLAGSGLFARASNGLLVILLVATFSIPFSALIMQPFRSSKLGIEYTGLSMDTFKDNLMPRFTKGADGSQLKGRETWQDLFGILFPATGGIFAGASMSGDLKNPSQSIPKGTLYGLALTFFSYVIVILAMAATITRQSFYHNVNVIQDVNVSGIVVLLGEFATSFFSALMGVIGSAKLLQALARDNLIPGLSIFGQGTKGNDEPTYAIIISYAVAQLTMLADINQIASFVTMTYLMTFLVTNLACFLLKVGSAPNFRPSFHYFNWFTAATGTIISGATMFFVDGSYASGCVGILIIVFLLIHYTTPPKSWGDVSQSLIYHQVRKYLLRLRQEHVKFWRPQILLFINDPRRQYKLIQFCNSLKKGSLFILGHVIVTQDFASAVPEARRQQSAWTKYIDFSKIKAFVNIAISPAVEWGARNIVLSAGLGGMRPNIVIMGFFNLNDLRRTRPLIDIPSPQHSRTSTAIESPQSFIKSSKKSRRQSKTDKFAGALPTDENRAEGAIAAQSYLTVLEDLLLCLRINVAVAKGFQELEFPGDKPSRMESLLSTLHLKDKDEEPTKKYIDLWPIQMSAELASENGQKERKRHVLTTNFDTYTLILQLGCILNTVPSWKRTYKLRVAVFVEYESDVEEERGRVAALLSNLRIEAEILVFWLASGNLNTYEIIVNGQNTLGDVDAALEVDEALKDEEWWQDIQKIRGRRGTLSASQELADVEGLLGNVSNWPTAAFQHGRHEERVNRFEGLKKMIRKSRRRGSLSTSFKRPMGGQMGMTTHRLNPDLVEHHASHASASESSSSDSGTDTNDSDLAYSENDLSSSSEENETPIRRSKSLGARSRPARFTRDSRDSAPGSPILGSPTSTTTAKFNPIASTLDASSSDTALLDNPSASGIATRDYGTTTTTSRPKPTPSRPSAIRQASSARFTSRTLPRTTIANSDGPGPSIMFSDDNSPSASPDVESPDRPASPTTIRKDGRPSPARAKTQPSQQRTRPTPSAVASAGGFPSPQAFPLSFNDLPCRAQHLVLNELIRQQSSDEAAVVFTTLPSPVEGTSKSEKESVRYLSDLEVLCQGLPPVLLVHSNSMTVTMNL